jgi:hypothetical protein
MESDTNNTIARFIPFKISVHIAIAWVPRPIFVHKKGLVTRAEDFINRCLIALRATPEGQSISAAKRARAAR